MKALLILLFCFWNTSLSFGQSENAVFDLSQIFYDIPQEAFPLSVEIRKSSFNANYKKTEQTYYKKSEIAIPNDSSVETHWTQFHLMANLDEKLGYFFEFKVYLTHKDTFLLTIFRTHQLLKVGQESTPPKIMYEPMLMKAYKLRRLRKFEEIELPEIKPTDFAKTPKDSLIILHMLQKGEVEFYASFETHHLQKKGIYFGLRDLTLRTGPFEPPVTDIPKYYSDYETIEHKICFLVTPNGITYEN